MSVFKAGDIVTTQTYAQRGEDYTYIRFDESRNKHIVRRNQRDYLETTFDKSVDLYLVRAAEENPTSPNVYKFPNAEVRDISAHLSSYGGQVVQYVARSTRLDGVFKDDRVQDLEKAKLMIQWEIDRLKEL